VALRELFLLAAFSLLSVRGGRGTGGGLEEKFLGSKRGVTSRDRMTIFRYLKRCSTLGTGLMARIK
jgi:hypothetical protein